MPADPTDVAAETAVVMQLLNRADGCLTADLHGELKEFAADRIAAAVESLATAGVLRRDGGRIYATAALQRLDGLGMIAI